MSLLNFFVTSEGLEEQLLGTVVTEERPDLANLKSQLVVCVCRGGCAPSLLLRVPGGCAPGEDGG